MNRRNPVRPSEGGVIMPASTLQRASPHDILQAWQDGSIGYREAMRLTGCESLFELYQACRSSGVAIRSVLTDQETRGVEATVSDLIGPQPNA
jgi:hypothetical protein